MSDAPHIPEHGLFAAIFTMSLLGWLPFLLAAIGSLVGTTYYCVSLWETRTVQHWVRNYRMKRNARRLMKLKAKEKIAVAKIEAAELKRQARVAARDLIEREIAEAAKLVAQSKTIPAAEVIERREADQEAEEAKP
jgi:hypothetical protein